MKLTEDNVVQHLLNKNERALPFIIDQYGSLLTAIIKRHLHNEHQDYEECLDDVLLACWHNIHYYNPEKNSFKQWLAAIAKYKAIDYQRKRIRLQQQQFTVADINESMLKSSQTSEESYVEELLEQLSTSERTIFEKYYLEGTPSNEIAKQYEVKESWVHNKLSRGRKKLGSFLLKNNEA